MERYTGMNKKHFGFTIRIRSLSYDEYVGHTFSLYIILNLLNIAFVLIWPEGLSGNGRTIGITAVFWMYFLFRSRFSAIVIKKSLPFFAAAWIIFIIAILAGLSDLGSIITRFLWLFAFGIPLLSMFLNVKDTEFMLLNTRGCVYVASSIVLLMLVRRTIVGYSMSMGYALLYPTLLLIHMLIKKKNFLFAVMLAINALFIVSYGSRGPILCIGVFLIIYIFFGGDKSMEKKVFWILLCAIIGIGLLFQYKNVLRLLIRILEYGGIQSRSLGYFLERIHYTGRELVWEAAIQHIKERPLLGWTVGVDISLLGFYPHQLFLEFLLHFGCIIGGVCSIYIVYLVLKNIIFCKKQDVLTLILCCYGFVPLMLSSEYLVWPSFWAFLGICLRKKKRIDNRRNMLI